QIKSGMDFASAGTAMREETASLHRFHNIPIACQAYNRLIFGLAAFKVLLAQCRNAESTCARAGTLQTRAVGMPITTSSSIFIQVHALKSLHCRLDAFVSQCSGYVGSSHALSPR